MLSAGTGLTKKAWTGILSEGDNQQKAADYFTDSTKGLMFDGKPQSTYERMLSLLKVWARGQLKYMVSGRAPVGPEGVGLQQKNLIEIFTPKGKQDRGPGSASYTVSDEVSIDGQPRYVTGDITGLLWWAYEEVYLKGLESWEPKGKLKGIAPWDLPPDAMGAWAQHFDKRLNQKLSSLISKTTPKKPDAMPGSRAEERGMVAPGTPLPSATPTKRDYDGFGEHGEEVDTADPDSGSGIDSLLDILAQPEDEIQYFIERLEKEVKNPKVKEILKALVVMTASAEIMGEGYEAQEQGAFGDKPGRKRSGDIDKTEIKKRLKEVTNLSFTGPQHDDKKTGRGCKGRGCEECDYTGMKWFTPEEKKKGGEKKAKNTVVGLIQTDPDIERILSEFVPKKGEEDNRTVWERYRDLRKEYVQKQEREQSLSEENRLRRIQEERDRTEELEAQEIGSRTITECASCRKEYPLGEWISPDPENEATKAQYAEWAKDKKKLWKPACPGCGSNEQGESRQEVITEGDEARRKAQEAAEQEARRLRAKEKSRDWKRRKREEGKGSAESADDDESTE